MTECSFCDCSAVDWVAVKSPDGWLSVFEVCVRHARVLRPSTVQMGERRPTTVADKEQTS